MDMQTSQFRYQKCDFSKVTSYSQIFYSAPSTVTIYVKDDAQKSWLNSKFTNLTNVKVAVQKYI